MDIISDLKYLIGNISGVSWHLLAHTLYHSQSMSLWSIS